MIALLLLLASGVATLAALAALTGVGSRRRGTSLLPAVAAGVFFPVTWIVWYVRDERPY